MKIWQMLRSGYQSPVVALTLGNHSYDGVQQVSSGEDIVLGRLF